jgi:hypothetical protein
MKLKNTMPKWVKELSPGTYSMSDLKKILGLTNCAIARQLVKYNCKIEKFQGPRNLIYHVYHWEGINNERIHKND